MLAYHSKAFAAEDVQFKYESPTAMTAVIKMARILFEERSVYIGSRFQEDYLRSSMPINLFEPPIFTQ